MYKWRQNLLCVAVPLQKICSLIMVFVSISFSMLITSGIKAPARALSFQTNSVAPHVIAATKILTTNFRMSFEYAPTERDDS